MSFSGWILNKSATTQQNLPRLSEKCQPLMATFRVIPFTEQSWNDKRQEEAKKRSSPPPEGAHPSGTAIEPGFPNCESTPVAICSSGRGKGTPCADGALLGMRGLGPWPGRSRPEPALKQLPGDEKRYNFERLCYKLLHSSYPRDGSTSVESMYDVNVCKISKEHAWNPILFMWFCVCAQWRPGWK